MCEVQLTTHLLHHSSKAPERGYLKDLIAAQGPGPVPGWLVQELGCIAAARVLSKQISKRSHKHYDLQPTYISAHISANE